MISFIVHVYPIVFLTLSREYKIPVCVFLFVSGSTIISLIYMLKRLGYVCLSTRFSIYVVSFTKYSHLMSRLISIIFFAIIFLTMDLILFLLDTKVSFPYQHTRHLNLNHPLPIFRLIIIIPFHLIFEGLNRFLILNLILGDIYGYIMRHNNASFCLLIFP